jgi:hypothetical protein
MRRRLPKAVRGFLTSLLLVAAIIVAALIIRVSNGH